jgi:hypothetical protein
MLPQGYGNYKTVHRRFQEWCRDETLRKVARVVQGVLLAPMVLLMTDCETSSTVARSYHVSWTSRDDREDLPDR